MNLDYEIMDQDLAGLDDCLTAIRDNSSKEDRVMRYVILCKQLAGRLRRRLDAMREVPA